MPMYTPGMPADVQSSAKSTGLPRGSPVDPAEVAVAEARHAVLRTQPWSPSAGVDSTPRRQHLPVV
eukprot:349679-Chlamydomonas_euryale.AAC.11